jgi:hypothetical protein
MKRSFLAGMLLLTICTLPIAMAGQENIHERHMERAHPTPVLTPETEVMMVPFIEEAALPTLFTNVNMIVAAENDQLPTQNESSIAISPLNPNLIIGSAVDYRGASSTWAYYSTDAGRTWSNVSLGTARPGWASTNDPSVCFDHRGKGFLCYGGFRRTGNAQFGENGIFVSSTTDAGKTWSMKHTAVIIHTGVQTADSAFEDKYYVHADTAETSPHRGALYIPWKRVINRDSSTQIMIAKSTDQGASWSVPVAVSERFPQTSEATTFGQSFPLARTGPDGSVHVVWNSGTESAIRYARSTDGGMTWTAPRIIHRYNPFGIKSVVSGQSNSRVKGVVRAECYPTLTIDNTRGPRNGWLYMCWAADNYPNVYASRSTDNGTTWSSPKIVHSDTTNDQFWSWITLDPTNGDVAVMYSDSRDDTANILVRTYVSLSTDGGSTWVDRRAGDGNSDLRNNPFSGNTFAGDYSGCDFRNGIVYPSWVDMRNTTTANKADNDVYTAIVNTRAPSSPQRFTATTLPDAPTEIDLSWDAITSRAFGQPLAAGDFSYVLMRDRAPIAVLASNERSFRDRGLTKYQKYEYTLVAVAGTDSSAPQQASAWAGGSRQPGVPKLIKAEGSSSLPISCTVELPSKRLDGITPLVNISKLVLTATDIDQQNALVVSDSGRIVMRDITVDERGWYRMQARVVDADGNESPMSDSIWLYTGDAGYRSEDFTREPRYRKLQGAWGTTTNFYRSWPASYAHARAGSYQPNRRDTLQLMPIVPGPMIPEASLVMEMHVAAFIDATDTMFMEASTRGIDGPYDVLEWWNASKDARWSDTTKADDAWRTARVRLPIGRDTTHLRLRFRSNASRQSDGFYMDDIDLLTTSVSEQQTHHVLSVFPSPSSSHCNVTLPTDLMVDDAWLTDMTGLRCMAPWYQRGTTLIVDIQALASGRYVLSVRSGSTISSVSVMIVR